MPTCDAAKLEFVLLILNWTCKYITLGDIPKFFENKYLYTVVSWRVKCPNEIRVQIDKIKCTQLRV